MNKMVEAYGITYLFCMFVLILIGLLGFSVYYKPISDASAYVVDIIEVHEGFTEEAQNIINDLDDQLSKAQIEIATIELSEEYKVYEVVVTAKLHIPIMNVDIPLTSHKKTKRCLY